VAADDNQQVTRCCLSSLLTAALLLGACCCTGESDSGPSTTGSAAIPSVWTPAPGTTWQWQLTGTVDLTVEAEVFDVDGFDTDPSVVERIHAAGAKAICYVSVGAWEDWRPDAADFPASVIGEANGWPGERWFDIRRIDVLRPLIEARLDLCHDKGFDAVEPDNVDGFQNDTGFPLTAADQLAFNRFVAEAAHARGLSVGLKNDPEQVPDLVADFDWALTEQCHRYGECEAFLPFIAAGKAVFHVEYEVPPSEFCEATTALAFSSMAKSHDLDASRQPCWEP